MDDAKVNELYDRSQITEVIYRYSAGLDQREWELFRTCFADPVHADFTSAGTPAARTFPLDTWVRVAQKTVGLFAMTQHWNSNVTITVDGDKATAVVYLRARHLNLSDASNNKFWDIGGYYTDHLVRTPDGWKIASIKFTRTWTEGQP
jgi:hypothetical protein